MSLYGCCSNGQTRFKAWTYEVLTCAEAYPISLEEIKRHLRISVTNTTNDVYLTSLIIAASNYVERYTHRTLVQKQFRTYRDCFPPYIDSCCREEGIQLRKYRLQSVDSFQYLVDDVWTTVDSSIYYTTDENPFSSIFLKSGQCWPTNVDDRHQAVRIDFTAGFGANNQSVPEELKVVIKHIVADLYQNRGDCGVDSGGNCSCGSKVNFMLDSWRILEIGC